MTGVQEEVRKAMDVYFEQRGASSAGDAPNDDGDVDSPIDEDPSNSSDSN
jgi:hypothetical protein